MALVNPNPDGPLLNREPKTGRPCSVDYVGHKIIEQQVMASLSDKGKVALVLDVDGLGTIIAALEYSPEGWGAKRSEMLRDLKQLRSEAFGLVKEQRNG